MPDLKEISAMLIGSDAELRGRITRNTASSAVTLFAVYESNGTSHLKLAGSGTLVVMGHHYGILTAAHVWEDVLRPASQMGITLTDNINHRHLLDIQNIIPTTMKPSGSVWNEWGPDLAFLQIPAVNVGAIQTYLVFEDLNSPSPKPDVKQALEVWVAIGTPEETGTFTQQHASVEMRSHCLSAPPLYRTEPGSKDDYYDFEVETGVGGVPNSFGGFSGGGLWMVLVYPSSQMPGGVDWVRSLQGVIYWQSPVLDGRRTIRCHGPESLSSLFRIVAEK
jgi:hypothetical protein